MSGGQSQQIKQLSCNRSSTTAIGQKVNKGSCEKPFSACLNDQVKTDLQGTTYDRRGDELRLLDSLIAPLRAYKVCGARSRNRKKEEQSPPENGKKGELNITTGTVEMS